MKRALEAFVTRKRDDFRAALSWQDADIERALTLLPVRPPLWKTLRRSQRICVAVGAYVRRFAIYSDMGTGKSLVGMSLAEYYREAERARTFLVMVPNRVNISGWLDQIAKHAPHIDAVAMPSSVPAKLELLTRGAPLLVIETYAGLTRLCTSSSDTGKLVIDPERLVLLARDIDGMILDESSAIGHHESLQTKIVTAFAKIKPDMPVFLMSGTPFGRDPHLLWSQMRIVDKGWTLGETLGLFRAMFFSTKHNPWGGFEHHFEPRKMEQLHRYIAHRSIRFALDEADLPALTSIVVDLQMAKEAEDYYTAALTQLRGAKGSYQLMKNAFTRMRQISSGYINVRDEDTGNVQRLALTDNPKLDWVRSELPDMDGQCVIFHEFNYSGEVLKRELDKLDISNCTINGVVGKTAVANAYRDFTTGKKQVLLLNSQAGAFGINLQCAKYGIYYESPTSVIIRNQTMLRFHRPESPHKSVVAYDLVMKGTVDAAILEFHKMGKDLFQGIIEGTYKP